MGADNKASEVRTTWVAKMQSKCLIVILWDQCYQGTTHTYGRAKAHFHSFTSLQLNVLSAWLNICTIAVRRVHFDAVQEMLYCVSAARATTITISVHKAVLLVRQVRLVISVLLWQTVRACFKRIFIAVTVGCWNARFLHHNFRVTFVQYLFGDCVLYYWKALIPCAERENL